MITTVKPKRETEIDKAIRLVREKHRLALKQNEMKPGFIKSPVNWALYMAWKEMEYGK